MRTDCPPRTAALPALLVTALLLVPVLASPAAGQAPADGPRAMTFLDMQEMARAGAFAPSRDGKWMLYTVTTPDWEEATQQSDVHLVSLEQGAASARRMTYTDDKNEHSPRFSRDGRFFVFASNRDARGGRGNDSGGDGEGGGGNKDQLYLMRPDGGEARRITDADDGVSDFAFSHDGRWLAYRSGEPGREQLLRLPIQGIDTAMAAQLTDNDAGVEDWEWAPDSSRIYFIRPDRADVDDRLRKEMEFTVDIRNQETPLSSLWALEVDTLATTRLTDSPEMSVTRFTISDDGRWVGFVGASAERYERNITEERINADLYLLETSTGEVERLTDNHEVGESPISFSPDGRLLAFSAPDDLTAYSMRNRRIYVREIADRGGVLRKVGAEFDGHASPAFWSDDGGTVFFNGGVRVTRQLHSVDVATDTVQQLTHEDAALGVTRDHDSGVLLINYADPNTPPTLFTVASVEDVGRRTAWRQLVDVNRQVEGLLLGEETEVTWTSTDGDQVGGVLVKPVGYEEGTRYPLIVAIHGGPAGADTLRFNCGYGSQVYAGAGYAVLKPNYRGSSNYGEAHRTAIVGNYFPQGYDDIMTGVDHLIAEGIVDPDRMGALGWSAGGHWSNWILTHTDRFKAISSGAGTSNWISMYAQSDVQRNRQFYLGNDLPYDNYDAYWEQSPMKYIKNAKTPTMIHVVEGDPRVPSPQSVELHMGLKKLGVPTELFMYPGRSHGIPDPRNRLVKSVSEMAWMDYYVRGIGEKFAWRDVLETLEADDQPAAGARR